MASSISRASVTGASRQQIPENKDPANRTLQWLSGLFSKANNDSELEFEVKFCDQFQGLVPEDPSDFQVGVNYSRFSEIVSYLEKQKFLKQTEKETVQYLNRSAINLYGDMLCSNHPIFIEHQPANIRIIHRHGMPRPIIISKLRDPHLPDGEQSVLPEGFKMTLSREKTLSDEECVVISNSFSVLPEGIFTKRHKDRISFIQTIFDSDNNSVPVLRIDMTTTTTVNGEESDTRHEIELEYIGNKNLDGGTQSLEQTPALLSVVSKIFFENIQTLLCLIHGSKVPLNVKQHNAVIRCYLEFVGNSDPYAEISGIRPSPKDMFVGCQPESLHERHLQTLVTESYFISGKTNGDRYQMIAIPQVSPEDQPFRLRCYIINRWMHVLCVGLRISIPREAAVEHGGIQEGFLLDGEVITDDAAKTETYWPFDVLRVGSIDMRPKPTSRRIEHLKTIIQIVKQYGIQISNRLYPMTIELKDIVFWPRGSVNAGDLVQLLRPIAKMPVDGLIFMRDEPHPRRRQWPGLFKWKGERSTVDLLAKDNEMLKRWDIFAGGNTYSFKQNKTNVVFMKGTFATIKKDGTKCLIFKRAADSREICYWVLLASGAIIQQASRDLIWSDTRSLIPFPFCPFVPKFNHVSNIGTVALEDGMVFEFYYDEKNQTLVPFLKRLDKSVLGIDGANDLRVAVDVWESMKYAVTKEQLFDLSVSKLAKNTVKLSDYPNVKDFHKSFDYVALFNGRLPSDVPLRPSEREMQNLRLLHNRIKQKIIHSIRVRRVLMASDILKANGGVLTINRDHRQNDNRNREQEWCLPKTAQIVLNTILGVQNDDMRITKDRIYVMDRRVAGISITQQPQPLIVVDLCCGKGGDLAKYLKNDIAALVCVDNEASLLTGLKDSALNRWAEFKSRNASMDTCFILADCRQPLFQTLNKRGVPIEADVVSCFFALHYFFSTERDARSFFQNVKSLLKPDGVFIGTIIDGELMQEKLREFGGCYSYSNGPLPMFTVSAVNFNPDEPLPPFGAHVDVELDGTILEQYDALSSKAGAKQENLVNWNVLVDLASEYDLELTETETFNQHFPDAPDITLAPEMAAYSSTHRSFKFRKLSPSACGGQYPLHQMIQSVQRLQMEQLETKTVINDIGQQFAAEESIQATVLVAKLTLHHNDEQLEDKEPEIAQEYPKEAEPLDDGGVKAMEIEDDVVIPDEIETEHEGCGERCVNSDCRGCKCRRKHKSKCTSACKCGPRCKNR